jgi:NAD-specific glutamate dehydrogenase
MLHLLDLLDQPSLGIGDGDIVLLPRGLVLCRHIQDASSINVEVDSDLGHVPNQGDVRELKLAKEAVVLVQVLSLVHLDEHTSLVVRVGGEEQLFLYGDSSVSWDDGIRTIITPPAVSRLLIGIAKSWNRIAIPTN